MRGGKKYSLIVISLLPQSCVGDVVSLEIFPGGELLGGFRELKMAARTPSEILQPRGEF